MSAQKVIKLAYDPNVASWRPADVVPNNPQGFTIVEKTGMNDLAKTNSAQTPAKALVKTPPQTPSQTPVKAGTKRKYQDGPGAREKSRLCGSPIWLSVSVGSAMCPLRWDWRDNSNSTISEDIMNLKFDAEAQKSLRFLCIQNYDLLEEKRVKAYNRDLIITVAQRRMLKWVRDGSMGLDGYEARTDEEDRYVALEKPNLARDSMRRLRLDIEEMEAQLARGLSLLVLQTILELVLGI
ncbi:hypothetical protein FSARC_5592 [Fusarium sarcochroum]|uniref:Uncharacterized protein n=1 Tax=Fusarium sarcochroum TaxID=1208366 RepID=A0A8H4XA09_9HYPO|nr:hypothetical protein FSARC_5592 [Fusarium sarcochroum]